MIFTIRKENCRASKKDLNIIFELAKEKQELLDETELKKQNKQQEDFQKFAKKIDEQKIQLDT
jgi:hypothetical protein